MIFCAGITVRSGTNFLGSIFSKHPDISSVPKNMSKGEFPFFRSRIHDPRNQILDDFNRYFFAQPRIDEKSYFKGFGCFWKKMIIDYYKIDKPYFFVKDPNIFNIEHFYNFFPDGKLIIIVRDGRDIVHSMLKVSLLIRKSQSWLKKLKARIKYYTGISRIQFSRNYKYQVDQILLLNELKKNSGFDFYLLKFEDIVLHPENTIKKLFKYLEIPISDEIISNMIAAEVVGSSFFKSSKNSPKWSPVKKSGGFNPIGRWKTWNWLQRTVFYFYSKDALKRLNY